MTGGLATAALAAAPTPAGKVARVNGTVFHDRIGDGMHRPGDAGLIGVLVSNGVDVAVTDPYGRYDLPARDNSHVFVIKPAGWSVGRRGNGLPAFFSALQGTSVAEIVDFALKPAEEAHRFDVALLADTQPQTMLELGYLRDTILPAVTDTHASFAINHGDVVFDNKGLHDRYLDLIGTTAMPWHHCPGNHDVDWDGGSRAAHFASWHSTFGPCHYAFQYGPATFILLNNVDIVPANLRARGAGAYRGAIGAEQLLFVGRLLAHIPDDQLVVVSMHIPLVGWEDPTDAGGMTADRRELLKLLSGRPHTLSLAGHTHTTEHHYLGAADGFSGPGQHHHHVLTAACGSWWSGPFDAAGLPLAASRDGTPKGFHVLSIDRSTYATRFVAVGHAGHPQMRLGLEEIEQHSNVRDTASRRFRVLGAVSSRRLDAAAIVANVFDGGPRTTVECQITPANGRRDARRLRLVRTRATDVMTAELYARHGNVIKPWVQPSDSSHLWRAKLPADLADGGYRAEIIVTDEYGRIHQAAMIFEIVA